MGSFGTTACVNATDSESGIGETEKDGSTDASVESADTDSEQDTADAIPGPYCIWDVSSYCCSGRGEGTAVCDNWDNAYCDEEETICCDRFMNFDRDGFVSDKCSDDIWCVAGDPYCGDGIWDKYWEACDDWNFDAGDGCFECEVEPGFVCPAPKQGYECVRIYECGNGVIETLEVCDDGNTISGDGCSGDCLQRESGFYCLVPGEDCVTEDDCAPDCPVCGDGKVDPGELCDDGENDGSYGSCAPGCVFGPRCGDGVVDTDAGEQCDDVVLDNRYGACNPGCILGPHCGDGVVDPDYEFCDDGDENGTYGKCRKKCNEISSCGDGVIDPGFEDCDEGGAAPNEYCDTECHCSSPE